jgi:hypothetical protein
VLPAIPTRQEQINFTIWERFALATEQLFSRFRVSLPQEYGNERSTRNGATIEPGQGQKSHSHKKATQRRM